jgi:hypothetical protein
VLNPETEHWTLEPEFQTLVYNALEKYENWQGWGSTPTLPTLQLSVELTVQLVRQSEPRIPQKSADSR